MKVVNMIRGRALNHRLFRSFCEEVGKEHTMLLYHTEVRWLSRGCVLSRLFELRDEIQQFLREAGHELAEYFDDPEFVQALAYLADAFTALNELNRSLQGRGISILDACEKLSAFRENLLLWISRVKKGNLVNFSSLEETLTEDASLHPHFLSKHLQLLCISFDGYFSCGELQICDHWIRHPFRMNLEDIDDDSDITEDLIDTRNNCGIQMEFSNGNLEHFWASQMETYPVLAEKALDVLVPFATTYL